jgi:predicted anti-sigma-YlaC factor YlaD
MLDKILHEYPTITVSEGGLLIILTAIFTAAGSGLVACVVALVLYATTGLTYLSMGVEVGIHLVLFCSPMPRNNRSKKL